MGRPWRLYFWIPVLLAASVAGEAGQLPTRHYSTEQGLPHHSVSNVMCDSNGFLGICNARGLSRFDGNGLENYSRAHGLPADSVTDTDSDPLPVSGGFFYLVTAENRLAEEGTKGFTAEGAERLGTVCP